MNFTELVTSSVLARGLALAILALALLGAIVVAVIDYIGGHPVPQEILTFIYVGLGAALTITGVNFGVVLQPAPKVPMAEPAPAPDPQPLPPGGGANANVSA